MQSECPQYGEGAWCDLLKRKIGHMKFEADYQVLTLEKVGAV